MKNIHLMWMDSNFNQRLVQVLNERFPHEDNLFVWRTERTFPEGLDNACVDPSKFSVEAINSLSAEWDQIFLHSLFLTDRQLLSLSEDAARKIVWVVWGHDLYRKLPRVKRNIRSIAYYVYKWMQKYSPFFYLYRKRVAGVVNNFRCIAIGYSYDEKYIRKKYGNRVPVKYGPYFSRNTGTEQAERLRELHLNDHHPETNILIGHCGSPIIQHEKYLKKLARYKNENVHIYLVLSYLASLDRIAKIKNLANSIYREDQYTIITETMPQDDYFVFLSKMDIAVFPFKIQSALGNTKRLAFMGVKMYFNPNGVLAKGFNVGGVQTFDCRQIGRISFQVLSQKIQPPNPNAPLFCTFDFENNVKAWEKLLV